MKEDEPREVFKPSLALDKVARSLEADIDLNAGHQWFGIAEVSDRDAARYLIGRMERFMHDVEEYNESTELIVIEPTRPEDMFEKVVSFLHDLHLKRYGDDNRLTNAGVVCVVGVGEASDIQSWLSVGWGQGLDPLNVGRDNMREDLPHTGVVMIGPYGLGNFAGLAARDLQSMCKATASQQMWEERPLADGEFES